MIPNDVLQPKESPKSKAVRLTNANATKLRALQLFAEFFCLRTNDAAELMRGRCVTESDARSVRRTLAILFKDGFLYRLPYFDSRTVRGGATYAYGLSEKGVRHALATGYASAATKTLDEHSTRTLDHELELSLFHIAVYRMCVGQRLRFAWRQTDLKHTVHPDAVFNVSDPLTPGKAYCYFLEIERAKLGQYRDGEPQILRKLRKYHEYFNSTNCETEWGFRQFRVIVVQRSDVRREGLLHVLRKHCPHRMFWLTTEAAYRSDIAGPIFKTPKDDATIPFSFLKQQSSPPYDSTNRPQGRE
jgi:hypothetical protein